MTRKVLCVTRFAILLLAAAMTVAAQSSKQGMVRPISRVKFEQDADVKCLISATENGDPTTGASAFILKATPDCVVPWHYHTAEEQLIVVHGNVLAEMDGISPTALGPGGFAMMPSKEKHQFSCKSKTECIMIVTFDRPYDIQWVRGNQSSRGAEK